MSSAVSIIPKATPYYDVKIGAKKMLFFISENIFAPNTFSILAHLKKKIKCIFCNFKNGIIFYYLCNPCVIFKGRFCGLLTQKCYNCNRSAILYVRFSSLLTQKVYFCANHTDFLTNIFTACFVTVFSEIYHKNRVPCCSARG